MVKVPLQSWKHVLQILSPYYFLFLWLQTCCLDKKKYFKIYGYKHHQLLVIHNICCFFLQLNMIDILSFSIVLNNNS